MSFVQQGGRIGLAVILTTSALATGCGQKESVTRSGETSAATSSSGDGTAISADAANPTSPSLPLQFVSWEETQEIVASHRGKVVVLDLWSTYCPPCVKELPGLAKLHDAHPDKVVCLTLNCNFNGAGSPEDERELIGKILTASKAEFQNLVSRDADESLYKKVGIASIPVVQVYDQSGKLSKQFDNEQNEYGGEGFSYAQHIAPLVESLVHESR